MPTTDSLPKGKCLSERVIEAYEKGQVKPSFSVGWGKTIIDDDGPVQCGCGLTALVIHEKPEQFPTVESFIEYTLDPYGTLFDTLGLSHYQVDGFINGFDTGKSIFYSPTQVLNGYKEAFEEGVKVRKYLLQKYPELKEKAYV